MTQNETMPKARVQVAHPYLCLMGLYLGGFTGMYSETALNIALPQLSATFGVEITLTQWLVVGYMLAIGVVLPFSSLLMKWFSARKITTFALSAFLIGSLISAFAPGFATCLAGRIIQGVGTGLVLPLMFAMVLEVFPPHKIGAAMGINALIIMFASAIGTTLAGIIVGAFSWRFVFLSFALILIVGLFFTLKFQVNPYELTKPHIDVVSVFTSVLGFGGIVLGMGLASLLGWVSVPTDVSLIVGVIALVIYVRRQLGLEVPIIDLRIFTYPGFLFGALCVTFNFGIILSALYILPQFYQNSMLLAVSVAGLVMLPGGIVNALVSMIAGRIYDAIGARIPALIGFALTAVAVALLTTATPDTPLVFVVCCHVMAMVGIPLAMSPCQTHALASLPPRYSTDGSTMLNTLQQVFGAVCTAFATFLLASGQSAFLAGGASDTSLAFAQGSHWGLTFSLALAVLAFLCATQLKKRAAAGEQAEAAPEGEASILAQLMKTDVFALKEGDTALDALRLFTEKGISGAPVLDEAGSLVGFVSDGDIIGSLSKQDPRVSFYAVVTDPDARNFSDKLELLTSLTVGEISTKQVVSVDLTARMDDVCAVLSQHHLKKVPVLADGKLVGVINRSDITNFAVSRYAQLEA
ncbi:MAG: DHA2 family efflux MFS transporter permease subunit [Coriobacteriia bacterium]|nr:DHA2 family efflux MFS transporter permease subunit [Coriobacteriia bacterium]